jgi:hypothetical protein
MYSISAEFGVLIPGFPVVTFFKKSPVGQGLAEFVAKGHGGERRPVFSLEMLVVFCGERYAGDTYMLGHMCESTGPVSNREMRVSPPRVAVKGVATPSCLGHVVVENDIDFLFRALCCHSVENLDGAISVL